MTTVHNLIIQEIESVFEDEKSRKLKSYKQLNQSCIKGQTLFTGSSLMEHFPICELYDDYLHTSYPNSFYKEKLIYNRGIGGYTTLEFIRDMDTMLLDLKPSKVFINIGTNDMNSHHPGASWLPPLLANYEKIIDRAVSALPNTEFFLMAYYPVNSHVIAGIENINLKEKFSSRDNEKIKTANEHIALLAEKYDCNFIDANEGLTDDEGNLKKELTLDGVHMYPKGYSIVFNNIRKYL